jgi:hypothetical protein
MKWFINIVSKYLFIGEIVLFLHHTNKLMYKLLIRRILFYLTQKSALFYFSWFDFVENTRILLYI